MQSRVKLAAALLLAACSAKPNVANPVTHACETASAPARPAVRRLVAAVDALDHAPRTNDHVALLGAMRALRDSLEVVAPSRTAELARVRTMTQALERAIGNSDAHADFVRIGLVSAWHALEAVAPRHAGSGCYRTGLDSLVDASSKIAPEKRLAAQYPQVKAALHAASAAVLATEGSGTVAGR
jgi:hypothetical protein